MHHLKETIIDGVKFVLLPEELHDALVTLTHPMNTEVYPADWEHIVDLWKRYDKEIYSAE